MAKPIILGSGNVYIAAFTGELPDKEALMKEENRLGFIQGGATIEYKPSFYEAKDDLGRVSKSKITAEEVTFKTGIMTINGDTFEKICPTVRIHVDDAKKVRTVKIGGAEHFDGKTYVILFHYADQQDGDIWVMIVGKNQSGFTLSFTKDKETIIDAEFKAEPCDNEGSLIYYEEEIKDAGAVQPKGGI